VTYLLDTNVLSETRKRQPEAGVANWIAATPPDRLSKPVPGFAFGLGHSRRLA
jgi:predicted nucleic acid-binding protein